MSDGERPRVSVVVAVFEPGPAFDDLIRSLDAQTLDAARFEVLLCDDGSGEATRDRLAEVARDRPHVRVLYLPHTGWPGTPRNHGLAAARGEYVYIVDQDDWLFDAALEKLCDYADANASDVVIGKEVGIGRRLPRQIFHADIPRAVLGSDPILELLTPHKLFRTSFLRAHGIRFPDGRVRLEDHLFVMKAYFDAGTISVLASVPCYAWVKHPGSASSSRIEPRTYFPHLETVLELVEAHTEPGELRDRLLRHWYRGKILKRLAGRRMLRYPEDYRDRFLDVVQPIIERRFGPGVDTGLSFAHRVRSGLLRADRRADLIRLARFESDLQCRAVVTAARWSRGGGLHLSVDVRITADGEDALVFEPSASRPERMVWRPPSPLADLPSELRDAGADLADDRVDLVLRDGARRRRLPGSRSHRIGAMELSVDPVRVFARGDSSPGGSVWVKVRRAGWTFTVPLAADADVLARAGRSPVLAGRASVLTTDDDGVVVWRRDADGGTGRDFAARAVRRLRAAWRRLAA
ncbi:glycosyltransferase family 2 protein [Microbacterium sp. RD1]|uniref:glycosyltransferase family 2 protein n=1 Tax=Microbacterium sp. RD1 TaxID=3457313 RepID=UPI003FA52DD4